MITPMKKNKVMYNEGICFQNAATNSSLGLFTASFTIVFTHKNAATNSL